MRCPQCAIIPLKTNVRTTGIVLATPNNKEMPVIGAQVKDSLDSTGTLAIHRGSFNESPIPTHVASQLVLSFIHGYVASRNPYRPYSPWTD